MCSWVFIWQDEFLFYINNDLRHFINIIIIKIIKKKPKVNRVRIKIEKTCNC